MTPSKALRLSISKSFDVTIGMPATATGVREDRTDQATLLEMLNDESLLVLLDGPEGSTGVVMLDIPLLAALVEMQTVGFVRKTEPAPRKPTRTDAAVAETVLNDLLKRFATMMVEQAGKDWAEGFGFGAKLPDVRAMSLMIPEMPYFVLRAEVDLFLGTRQGRMLVALPAAPPGKTVDGQPKADPKWQKALNRRVEEASVGLTAVLHRLRMPIAQVTGLQVGQRLELPRDCLTEVRLISRGVPMRAPAALGKFNGMRAVRFHDVPGLEARLGTAGTQSIDHEDAAKGASNRDAMAARMLDAPSKEHERKPAPPPAAAPAEETDDDGKMGFSLDLDMSPEEAGALSTRSDGDDDDILGAFANIGGSAGGGGGADDVPMNVVEIDLDSI